MGIKAEVGKFYRTRGGEVAYTAKLRPTYRYPVHGVVFRFADDYTGGPEATIWTWKLDGKFNANNSLNVMDLVEELSPDHELVLVVLASLALNGATLEEYIREY